MTLDILICSLNKGIVRIDDLLLPQRKDVRYIVSYQYTDERYLELIPSSLASRIDVVVSTHKGQGLSSNRNHALELAKADLVMFADDDARLTDDAVDTIFSIFDQHPNVEVALFRASTYTGKLLKKYPEAERDITYLPKDYTISTIEMVCRRNRVQGKVRFDERFGLGTQFLTCGEEEVWLIDALRAGLSIRYYPYKVVETSTMLKRSMIYVDAGVQRSKGALTYYKYGSSAWIRCFWFAVDCTRKGLCHFIPMLRHLYQGILYLRHNG
jgi:glycosyltransferase, group 2 family